MNAEASLWLLLALGAVHGLNPAMGWLFAVSLGLQEGRRAAVWRAFGPLAAGHALAIAVALGVAAAMGMVMPMSVLKWVVGGSLVGMGALQLIRHPHPRVGGMRVGARELLLWSFLMASAHGAGLMAVPFVLGQDEATVAMAAEAHQAHSHAGHAPSSHASGPAMEVPSARYPLLATAVHTAGYLVAAALLALLVYELLGLRMLRSAWLNVNLVWALALILTGILTPLL